MFILFKLWAFIRQTLIRIYLFFAKIIYRLSGGKFPSTLFCEKANAEYIGTTVKIVASDDVSTTIAKFDADGNMTDEDFVILSSTDLHLDHGMKNNEITVGNLVRHIKDIKPDLVVLTGDVILTDTQQIDAIQFAAMMEKLGIYWTAVFGNHEVREERGFYKYLLLKDFADFKHCLCKHGPDELFGYGNYTVNILGKGGRLRRTLFFFDSGRNIIDSYREEHGVPADMKGYDFLKNSQINFYKNTIDSLEKKHGKFPSFMYFHIPLIEFSAAFDGDEKNGYTPSGKCDLLYGGQFESVGSSPFNSGMFDAVLEKGSTDGIFVGHDHVNDWCAVYKGVHLVYSLPEGYNEYHMGTRLGKPQNEWVQGVTVTTMHADNSFDIKPVYDRIYLK